MGLLFNLLGAPVALPARGLMFIFDKIAEQVNNELLDEGKVRLQLLELQTMLDSGHLSEAEFYAAEESLLDRLDAILAFKESQHTWTMQADNEEESERANELDDEPDDADDLFPLELAPDLAGAAIQPADDERQPAVLAADWW
jgi:hypothetical protein